MEFDNLYNHGFARVAAITPPVHLGSPRENAAEIIKAARAQEATAVIAFPELCVSGYSCDDLFGDSLLLRECAGAIEQICEETKDLPSLLVIGAPLQANSMIFNCALTIAGGKILAITPKLNLPTYREFYEQRYFTPGEHLRGPVDYLPRAIQPADPATRLVKVKDIEGLVVGVEVCEDMWVANSPGAQLARSGATLIVNPSASPITVGRASERELLVGAASSKYICGYLYSAAGYGESSTDLAWDGQSMIYETGQLLAESERFQTGTCVTVTDLDLQRINGERRRQTSFIVDQQLPSVEVELGIERECRLELARTLDRFPFVPDDAKRLDQDCFEAFNIQVTALMRRMEAIGSPKIIIGVSGGLDSTHALLVAVQAMDRLGRGREEILAYTMPGFGTAKETKNNATELSRLLGVSFQELDITPAAHQMLAGLEHPFARGEEVYDVTFENVQAGLRTDYLFRLANHHGGIVLGTGDLSELALGWCTYGVGDQMSHYGVNAGIPKTLMQHLIRWVVNTDLFGSEIGRVLTAILNTEISPELIPAGADGKTQSTEDSIGPYALHDFTLYHLLRYGSAPARIAYLELKAWGERERGQWPSGYPSQDRREYDLETILKWLRRFYWRFFANQFKRTAMPSGPKVMAGGSLSPRGDWRMPADATAKLWLAEIEALQAGNWGRHDHSGKG